jgi:chaperonin GroES
MNIKPLRDNVLVKVDKAVESSKGGIFLPATTQEKPFEGEVIAVGVGKVFENGITQPLSVAVGDRVMFGKYVTMTSIPDSEDLVMMSEDNILAII